MTHLRISGTNPPELAIAFAITFAFRQKANPVSLILLSLLAQFACALPEMDSRHAESEAVLSAAFRESDQPPISQLLQRPAWLSAPRSDSPVVRAQNGTYESPPIGAPMNSQTYQPMDPFQQGTDPVLPFLNDPGPMVISGINGPQPYRLGFTPLFDYTYIAASTARAPGSGNFTDQEYAAGLRHTSELIPDWFFTNTAQANIHLWDGPVKPDLPGAVYRLGWDFLLNTPTVGPWSAAFDFNPSINTDFQEGLQRQALNLDGNITAFYRVSPQLLLVLGVQYWDRVDKIIIPNAGVVWNPDDRLEMRLLFPKTRISYFLGNFGPASHWIYGTAEYRVDSYQIAVPGVTPNEQVQFSDWRIALGLRSDHQWYDKYVEIGYVFSRHVNYLRTTPGFDINDGLMVRAGVRF